jgi:hypothetical protein
MPETHSIHRAQYMAGQRAVEPTAVLGLIIPGTPQNGHLQLIFMAYEGPGYSKQLVWPGQKVVLRYQPWTGYGRFTQIHTVTDSNHVLFEWRAEEHPRGQGELLVAVHASWVHPDVVRPFPQKDIGKYESCGLGVK